MKILEKKKIQTLKDEHHLIVHAASIEIFKGKKIIAYFSGIREGKNTEIFIKVENKDPVSITEKRLTKYGFNTSFMSKWNPVLFSIKDKLFMFYKEGTFCDCWTSFIVELSIDSEDNVEVVSESMMPTGLYGSVKNRPIFIEKEGYPISIICPSSVESSYNWTSYIEQYYLEDGVIKFNVRSKPITFPKNKGVLQPAIFQQDDTFYCLMRTGSRDLLSLYRRVFCSVSKDLIRWSEPVPTQIPNPNSSIHTLKVSEKEILFIYNDSVSNRENLRIGFFDTETMNVFKDISIDDFGSYPYAVFDYNKNLVDIVYSKSNRSAIYNAQIEL